MENSIIHKVPLAWTGLWPTRIPSSLFIVLMRWHLPALVFQWSTIKAIKPQKYASHMNILRMSWSTEMFSNWHRRQSKPLHSFCLAAARLPLILLMERYLHNASAVGPTNFGASKECSKDIGSLLAGRRSTLQGPGTNCRLRFAYSQWNWWRSCHYCSVSPSSSHWNAFHE